MLEPLEPPLGLPLGAAPTHEPLAIGLIKAPMEIRSVMTAMSIILAFIRAGQEADWAKAETVAEYAWVQGAIAGQVQVFPAWLARAESWVML